MPDARGSTGALIGGAAVKLADAGLPTQLHRGSAVGPGRGTERPLGCSMLRERQRTVRGLFFPAADDLLALSFHSTF